MTENQKNKTDAPEEPRALTEEEILGIALRIAEVIASRAVTSRFAAPSPDCFPVAGEEEDPREITAMLALTPDYYDKENSVD